MTASFTIKNANDELIQAIKHVIKLSSNATYKLKKIDESGYSDTFAKKVKKESKELDEQIANGTAKRFKSMAEYREYHGEL